MSPLMIQVLTLADAAEHSGLVYSRAGWAPEGQLIGHFASNTVDALVARGYMLENGARKWGERKCAITDAGRRALADWRSSH